MALVKARSPILVSMEQAGQFLQRVVRYHTERREIPMRESGTNCIEAKERMPASLAYIEDKQYAGKPTKLCHKMSAYIALQKLDNANTQERHFIDDMAEEWDETVWAVLQAKYDHQKTTGKPLGTKQIVERLKRLVMLPMPTMELTDDAKFDERNRLSMLIRHEESCIKVVDAVTKKAKRKVQKWLTEHAQA